MHRGLKTLGAEIVAGIRVVVSDMWRPYLAVVRKHLPQAVRILDRFHLTSLLNKAVDQVRRGEGAARRGQHPRQRLKQSSWLLLKRRARVRSNARARWRRVFTVSALMSRQAAVSAVLRPSTSRSMKTEL